MIAALLALHIGKDFAFAVEMLTRTSETNDFAPDVSVYPRARHPETGGRQLEELAFEVVSTETMKHAGDKAAKLVERGVRRVFAIDVNKGQALEWSRTLAKWRVLEPGSSITDHALAAPLPVEALVNAIDADDAGAQALIAKKNRLIEAVRHEGKAEGKVEGKREGKAEGKVEGKVESKAESVLSVLAARGIALRASERERILTMRDLAVLETWLIRAVRCESVAELFVDH